MATKTISVKMEAYEALRRARRYPEESFSEVILRAEWPNRTHTGGELMQLYADHGPFFTEHGLERIAGLKSLDSPAEDKWAES